MIKPLNSIFGALLIALGGGPLCAATYHVGPERNLSAIGQVPWESLQPGDEVLIDWRAEPYREKWVLCRQGTAKAPIVIRGIPNAKGELPLINGEDATTRSQLKYWGDVRGVVKIGGATVPPMCVPQYIIVENLEICGARPPAAFKAADGQTKNYKAGAAALYVERAQHLTVRNCVLRDCGNGLTVSSSDDTASSDILIEGCYIHGNGNPHSGQEHNIYTEAIGITFQYNHLGPLGVTCRGNNLKDRSAGFVARYNWIEGGDKPFDLVDAEDSALVRKDPSYHTAFIYGNIIIKPNAQSHPQVAHYGGDSPNGSFYRKGTLYFYNNTVVSFRKRSGTTLFWLSSNEEKCDCRNNIVYLEEDGKALSIVQDKGVAQLSHNWFKEGWVPRSVQDDGTSLLGLSPGFVDVIYKDFNLNANSPCRNAGAALPPEALPENNLTREYVKHQRSQPRPRNDKLNIGAF